MCKWTFGEAEELWITSCQCEWFFDAQRGPKQEGFEFCPFCGEPILEIREGAEISMTTMIAQIREAVEDPEYSHDQLVKLLDKFFYDHRS